MLDEKGFDRWSTEYDRNVRKDETGYPFEGYRQVLDTVYSLLEEGKPRRILDIGIGTGLLAQRFYSEGAEITGIDFSEGMLLQAKARMPRAKLIPWDMNEGIPPELEAAKFDCIVSTYVFHHFDDSKKLDLILQFQKMLNSGGRIVIGDIAFQTNALLKQCRIDNTGDWDETECYFVLDSFGPVLSSRNIRHRYTQISNCAGVLIIESID